MTCEDENICVNKTLLKEFIQNYGARKFNDGFLLGFVGGLVLGASFATVAFLSIKQK